MGLNGIIELLVPALLFLYFSPAFYNSTLRMCGINASMSTWRKITLGVALLIIVLIVAAYVLNACVRFGVYGPLRKVRHAAEEEDYSHYAAYDDLSVPPGPPGAPMGAPVGAPGSAPTASEVASAMLLTPPPLPPGHDVASNAAHAVVNAATR